MSQEPGLCYPARHTSKKVWRLHDAGIRVGHGQMGQVYAACRNEKCSYVVKIVAFKEPQDYHRRWFQHEVKLHNHVHQRDPELTPPIEDHWICGDQRDHGILILRVLDMTLNQFLRDVILDPDTVRTVLNMVSVMCHDLHALGYYHGDLHFGNIMVERLRDDRAEEDYHKYVVYTDQGVYKLWLIDFGKGGQLAKPGPGFNGKKMTAEKWKRLDEEIVASETRQVLLYHAMDPELTWHL